MRDWRHFTKNKLRELKISSSKVKGQNFLTRYRIANEIVIRSKINPTDHIIEIGGGLGILTDALVATGAKITIIEQESKFSSFLQKQYPSVEVITNDALKVNWPSNCKVVSNLPYSISTPIIDKIIHSKVLKATIMLQKEVATRCLSKPGDRNYSRLSVLCNIHTTVEKFFDVGPEAFFPQPKIDSTVIQLKLIELPLQNSHDELELLTRNLFSLRRRTLRSVVRGFLKRRNLEQNIWDKIPFKDKRIFELSVKNLDEILLFLKTVNAWPVTN